MNNLIPAILILIVLLLCYILYKLHKQSKALDKIYELPHGESLYSVKHHEFNSISLQDILIAVRAIMHAWLKQSVASEQYESAENWKNAICEIEKLITTKINK